MASERERRDGIRRYPLVATLIVLAPIGIALFSVAIRRQHRLWRKSGGYVAAVRLRCSVCWDFRSSFIAVLPLGLPLGSGRISASTRLRRSFS
jgi:hypothetical protein